jgi:nucleoside-diphosphate-sugar epimerase
MKIVVIGGSGLIGSKLVTKLREHGHEALGERTLVAGNDARLSETRFETWLAQSEASAHAA